MEVGIFWAKGAGGQATAKRFRTSAIYANFNQLLDRVHITKRRKPLIRRMDQGLRGKVNVHIGN